MTGSVEMESYPPVYPTMIETVEGGEQDQSDPSARTKDDRQAVCQ